MFGGCHDIMIWMWPCVSFGEIPQQCGTTVWNGDHGEIMLGKLNYGKPDENDLHFKNTVIKAYLLIKLMILPLHFWSDEAWLFHWLSHHRLCYWLDTDFTTVQLMINYNAIFIITCVTINYGTLRGLVLGVIEGLKVEWDPWEILWRDIVISGTQ